MGSPKEAWRRSEIGKLRCPKVGCGSSLGLEVSSYLNISKLTPTGVEPAVYHVACPRYLDELCSYQSLVVFVSPEADDPESLALQSATDYLESWCDLCRMPLDWSRAKSSWAQGDEDTEELELTIRCHLSLRQRLARLLGKRVLRHSYLRYVRWVEDESEDDYEDDEIPDRLPSTWLLTPVTDENT